MYIIDGIAYAGEQTPEIKVKSVRALPDYKLWIRFNDNSQKRRKEINSYQGVKIPKMV